MLEKFIELLKYLALSVIQGVGEVFPISSSGHLLLFRNILNINDEGVGIELFLHLASLLALFFYYRKIILKLTKGFLTYVLKKDKNMIKEFNIVKGMIVSLIPICLIGYFLNDYLDLFLKYPIFIGLFLILNSLNLYSIRNKNGDKKIEDLSIFSFFKIGLGQCIGLVPGFSRSGSALGVCYRERLNKEDSQTLTFLMLFPLVIGSIVLNAGEFVFAREQVMLLVISFVLTFVLTLVCISSLGKIMHKNKIHYFAYYCLIVGIILMFIG